MISVNPRAVAAYLAVGALGIWHKVRSRSRSHTIVMPTQYIVGDPNAGGVVAMPAAAATAAPAPTAARPVTATFTLRVNGFEKLAVSAADVQQQVARGARGSTLGGVGTPAVRVTDAPDGYYVSVAYPDSLDRVATAAEATRAVESADPRLRGRVLHMTVAR